MKKALAFVTGGVLVILAAWVPLFIRGIPLSLPMVAVAIGVVLSLLIDVSNAFVEYSKAMEHAAEFALLVAVLGAGLKIDRPFALRPWGSTWRAAVSRDGSVHRGHRRPGGISEFAASARSITWPTRSRAELDSTVTVVVGLVVLVSIVLYGTTTDAATRILLGRAAD